MPLSNFDYFAPKTIEEVCSLLYRYKERAKVIAGGTDILVRMKHKLASPLYLVNLKCIPNLDYIAYDDKDGLRIGTLTSLSRLEASPVIREKFPILAIAAGSVASAQVRNLGTLGGNLCLDTRCWYYNQPSSWRLARPSCYKTGGNQCYVVKGGKRCYSLFCGDTVPPLISLGAQVKVASLGGERVVTLEQFYSGTGETVTVLQPDEIVTEVQVPNQPARSGGSYLKYRVRGALDFAIVSVATAISIGSKNGICTAARIVLGAIASAPVEAHKAGTLLQGREITDDLVAEAAELATKEAGPIVYIAAPVDYKRSLLPVLVGRAIKEALKLAKSI